MTGVQTCALPISTHSNEGLHHWVTERLLPLASQTPEQRRDAVLQGWNTLPGTQRFLFNKLLTGGFRVGVSRRLIIRSLADFSGLPADVIAHRLMGHWQPSAHFFQQLVAPETADADISRPYSTLSKNHGINMVHELATAIDTKARIIKLSGGSTLSYDKLLLSPSIDLNLGSIEGLADAQASGQILQAWKAGPETLALRRQLDGSRSPFDQLMEIEIGRAHV